ncbi:PQ-loop domain-containing transporter [Mycoplasma marinum]|nr:PQ-loop domain-containing transporter [Mycoplasma marinum]
MTTRKHTIEVSLKSWIIMFIGRMFWCIYGFLLGTIGGIFILIAQGLIAAMTVPIIYYIMRNEKTKGRYHKDHFRKELFIFRIIMDFMVISIICILTIYSHYFERNNYTIPKEVILIVGTIGAAITAFALMPQSLKTIKSRNTESMSLPLQITFIIGNAIIISYLIYELAMTHNTMNYIGSIFFGIISTLVMVPIAVIKINNIIKLKEPLH